MAGWIAVDLDRTLAVYPPPAGKEIGPPIPLMLERVKRWLADGREVRIFTARVGIPEVEGAEAQAYRAEMLAATVKAIEEWCHHHIGQVLPVTATKDYNMVELWDDLAIQVIPNTGRRVDGGA
jgi:hypothetical protein